MQLCGQPWRSTSALTLSKLVSALIPVNHKGLHQGWTQTSLNLQVIHFTSHHTTSHVFFSLFIFRRHSTREPESSRVTYFILWAYTGISVSHSQFKLCILTRWDFNFCVHSSPVRDLIQVVKNLYNKATSAVLFNSSIGDWFGTTAGVRKGCLLSPTLFNIFLERIMTDALEDHEGTVCIGGRIITNLHFPDDIDSRRGRRTGKCSWASWQRLHSLRHGDQCWEDQADDTSGINTEIKMDRSLRQSQASSTWAQLLLMRVPSLRYSPG